jgi:hypothetical protein
MKSLAALFVFTVLGIVPALAETTTMTTRSTSRGYESTIQSSDGSSYTSRTERVGTNQYRTNSTYTPPSSYQPMKGYCPMGNCK